MLPPKLLRLPVAFLAAEAAEYKGSERPTLSESQLVLISTFRHLIMPLKLKIKLNINGKWHQWRNTKVLSANDAAHNSGTYLKLVAYHQAYPNQKTLLL